VLLMAGAGLVVVRQLFAPGAMVLMLLTVGSAVVLSLLLLFDSSLVSALVARLTARRFPVLHRRLGRALSAIRQYGNHPRTLFVVLGLSIGVQVLRILQAWTLGIALGVESGLVWYFAFLPVIILVMLLPTSVAGLGTGALAFQVLFGTVGVPPAQAYSMALLFSASSLVGNLPGGMMFAVARLPQRSRLR
jgi:uncharacterized membrane protein YbhN (UPF0104 family)